MAIILFPIPSFMLVKFVVPAAKVDIISSFQASEHYLSLFFFYNLQFQLVEIVLLIHCPSRKTNPGNFNACSNTDKGPKS